MTGHELYKIFVNKSTILFVVVLLMFNVVQLVYVDDKGRDWEASAYNEAWKDAKEVLLDSQNDRDAFEVWINESIAQVAVAGTEAEKESAAAYTGNVYTEMKLLERLKTEADFVFDYNEYLDSVEEAAKRYEMLSVFSEPDGYAYRDITLMKEAYDKVSDKTLIPSASAGVRMATHSDITDLIAIVLFLYLATVAWLKEREQNMLFLIRTTYRGRTSLALCKILVLSVSCVFFGTALYGSNMITAGIVYGLGDFGRPLASVYEYGHTLWEISVGEFLMLNLVFKILGYIWIMLLISVICLLVSSAVAAFAWIAAVSAAGCLMYYKIPALSVWATFKYLNPFAVLKTENLFEGYKSLNIFGYPVEQRYCVVVLFVVGYVLFCIVAVRCFVRYIIKGKRQVLPLLNDIKRGINQFFGRMSMHTSMLLHELYRIFICHRTLLVIMLFMVLIIYDSMPYEVRYLNFKYYYKEQYLTFLQGEVTEEKLDYIEMETERVSALSDEQGEARKSALKEINDLIPYFEENEGACFIYDIPHNLLTAGGMGNSTDFIRAVECLMPVVLIMPCFFAPDLQSGVNRMTDVTFRGKRKLKTMRYIVGTVLALIIAVMAHLSYFVQIMVSYGVDVEVFSYPVNSLTHLSVLGNGMSIGMYYMIIYTLKILATVAGAFLVYGLSKLLKSQAYTTLVSLLLMVVPFLVAVYEYKLKYVAYPYSAALGNLFVQEKAAAVVCVTAVVVVAVVLRCVRSRK